MFDTRLCGARRAPHRNTSRPHCQQLGNLIHRVQGAIELPRIADQNLTSSGYSRNVPDRPKWPPSRCPRRGASHGIAHEIRRLIFRSARHPHQIQADPLCLTRLPWSFPSLRCGLVERSARASIAPAALSRTITGNVTGKSLQEQARFYVQTSGSLALGGDVVCRTTNSPPVGTMRALTPIRRKSRCMIWLPKARLSTATLVRGGL